MHPGEVRVQLALPKSALSSRTCFLLQLTFVHKFGLITGTFLLQLSCPCKQPPNSIHLNVISVAKEDSKIRHAVFVLVLLPYLAGPPHVGLLRSWMAFKECDADFTGDLRHGLRGAWRAVEGVDPRTTNNALATYQAFFALPLDQNVCKTIRLPEFASGFASACHAECQQIQVESSHFGCGNCALGG
eukprot:1136871-Pelagomonas_calceolata.AAC.2